MKVRGVDRLVELISEDLSWRKRELVDFNAVVKDRRSPAQKPALRSAVALLYAHWEGFIKNACYYYLCYIATEAPRLNELRSEIVALIVRGRLTALEGAKRTTMHRELIRHLREDSDKRAQIPSDRSSVRTESNLTFSVLEDLLTSIGCNAAEFEEYRDLIDDQLVNSRNKIAHGEQEYIREPEWIDLYTSVIFLMDRAEAQICNAAVEKSFLSSL